MAPTFPILQENKSFHPRFKASWFLDYPCIIRLFAPVCVLWFWVLFVRLHNSLGMPPGTCPRAVDQWVAGCLEELCRCPKPFLSPIAWVSHLNGHIIPLTPCMVWKRGALPTLGKHGDFWRCAEAWHVPVGLLPKGLGRDRERLSHQGRWGPCEA